MNIWETDTFLARWLNNELSPDEKAAFEQSEEFAKFQQMKDAVEDFEAPAFDEEAALAEAMSRIEAAKPQAKVIPLNRWIQYAAAASVIIAAVLGVYFTLLADEIVEYTAAKQETLDLPDGSSIALKAGTFIKYNASDWEEARNIELQGEAFFEVEKGSPFKVQTTSGTVSVLGTSFTIDESEDTLKVVCYSGKVKVEGFAQNELLTKGKAVVLSRDYKASPTTLLNEPLWLDQIASYKEVPLKEVLSQFTDWYQVNVVGEYDEKLLYTGQFPIDDLEVALEQIFGPYQIEYNYSADKKEVQINPIAH